MQITNSKGSCQLCLGAKNHTSLQVELKYSFSTLGSDMLRDSLVVKKQGENHCILCLIHPNVI